MKNLKLADWAHIAEITACIMVIVSLLYGITEYNREKLIDTSEIDASLYQGAAALNAMIVTNDDLAALIMKADRNAESLTELEKFKYVRLQNTFFNDWERAYYDYREGRMDDRTWLNWNTAFEMEVKLFPEFVWIENRAFFPDPEFQKLVDDALNN